MTGERRRRRAVGPPGAQPEVAPDAVREVLDAGDSPPRPPAADALDAEHYRRERPPHHDRER